VKENLRLPYQTKREVWNKIFNGEESVGTVAMNGEAKIEGNLIQAI